MSEPRPRKSSAGERAEAQDAYRCAEDETLDDRQVLQKIRQDLPWQEWLRYDFARYWYVLSVIMADVFLAMEMVFSAHASGTVARALLAVSVILALAAAGYAEWWLYTRLWPEGILSGKEDQ